MVDLKLNLGLILDSLPASYDTVIGDIDCAMSLYGISPIIPSEYRDAAEDMLYTVSWDYLLTVCTDYLRYVVCVGGGDEARIFFEENEISGIIYPDNANLLSIFAQIQDLFRKYNSLEHELLYAIIADTSTRNILNCCAKFFEGHAMLLSSYSMGFILLDHSDNFIPPESDLLWRDVLTQKLTMNPREKTQMLPHKPDKYPKANFYKSTNGYVPHFVKSFDYGNLRFASLIIMGTERMLTSYQRWLVDYIADIIQPVITRRYNSSLNVRNHARTTLSNALHQAKQSGKDAFNTMTSALAQLRWKADDDYRIILVSLPPECHNVSHYLYDYENVFATSYFNCLSLIFEDFIFIVLRGDACSISTQQLEMLENQLTLDNGICSIGTVFCEFSQIASSFRLAILPIQLNSREKRIYYYSDMMTAHVINALESVLPLRTICNSAVLRLQKYDALHGTNLLATLEVYLMCNNSLQKAANRLFIHKNTMTYRLKSIEKAVKMDLTDPDERLSILLSCIILRILSENDD